jgi:hypothetical protein
MSTQSCFGCLRKVDDLKRVICKWHVENSTCIDESRSILPNSTFVTKTATNCEISDDIIYLLALIGVGALLILAIGGFCYYRRLKTHKANLERDREFAAVQHQREVQLQQEVEDIELDAPIADKNARRSIIQITGRNSYIGNKNARRSVMQTTSRPNSRRQLQTREDRPMTPPSEDEDIHLAGIVETAIVLE